MLLEDTISTVGGYHQYCGWYSVLSRGILLLVLRRMSRTLGVTISTLEDVEHCRGILAVQWGVCMIWGDIISNIEVII